ncbi:unnamed protein product [Amoebophrya sp. A25]|nr:unnamed protein product [Amoebophrya sp. A25]|eukprot:GSA25T00025305001.1
MGAFCSWLCFGEEEKSDPMDIEQGAQKYETVDQTQQYEEYEDEWGTGGGYDTMQSNTITRGVAYTQSPNKKK